MLVRDQTQAAELRTTLSGHGALGGGPKWRSRELAKSVDWPPVLTGLMVRDTDYRDLGVENLDFFHFPKIVLGLVLGCPGMCTVLRAQKELCKAPQLVSGS